MQNMNKPIVLMGMMGSGKSYIGKELAKILNVEFFDADKVLEEKHNMSIPHIFENLGETVFRDMETNVLKDLLEKEKCVISSGGGVVVRKESIDLIRDKSISIWLQTSVEKIIPRVMNDKNRPLLQCGDPKSKLEALMAVREPLYARADIHIKNEDQPQEVLEKIVQALSEFL